MTIVFKYSVWVIDSVVIKGAIGAAEVIYSTECDTRVVIICGYLRGWEKKWLWMISGCCPTWAA